MFTAKVAIFAFPLLARAGNLSENKELAEDFYWKALEVGWHICQFTEVMNDLKNKEL